MAEFDELTEEERLRQERLILEKAGPPIKLALPPQLQFEGEPFQIPGAPDQAAVAEHDQVRLDVARDQLANLKGDESPEFLAKLRREAGVEPANAAAPANNVATFTPPPQVSGNATEPLFTAAGTEIPAPVPTEQPEIDLATLSDESFNAPLQPGRQVANIDGPPVVRGLPDEGGGVGDFIRGTFANTIREATDKRIGDEVLRRKAEAETPAELGRNAGQFIAAEAGRLGRTFKGLAADVLDPRDIRGEVGQTLADTTEFLGGVFNLGSGPAAANAKEETDVTGQKDSDSGEQNELATGDAAEKEAEDAASRREVDDSLEVTDSPTTVSNQPGVQSGVSGGGVANRLLGPPLQPPGERGPGVEVIRGLRRTFQPLGPDPEPGATFTGPGGEEFPAGALAEGGEIPFGRGTLDRFQNAGFTLEQAGEMALAAEETEARLINAGAQDLIARTNAATPINIPLQDGSGRSVRGFSIIDGDAPDGVRFIRTNMLTPLSEDMFVSQTEVDTTDATGRTTKLKKPLFFLDSTLDGEVSMREVPVGSGLSSRIMAATEKNPDEFGIALDQAKEDGFDGRKRFNKALELLETLVNKGQ